MRRVRRRQPLRGTQSPRRPQRTPKPHPEKTRPPEVRIPKIRQLELNVRQIRMGEVGTLRIHFHKLGTRKVRRPETRVTQPGPQHLRPHQVRPRHIRGTQVRTREISPRQRQPRKVRPTEIPVPEIRGGARGGRAAKLTDNRPSAPLHEHGVPPQVLGLTVPVMVLPKQGCWTVQQGAGALTRCAATWRWRRPLRRCPPSRRGAQTGASGWDRLPAGVALWRRSPHGASRSSSTTGRRTGGG